jgi:chromosome segregation ATPase
MKERDAATVESVERLQQYTVIVVERDSIAQKLDAMTQKHDALIAERDTTAQDHVDLFDRMAAIFKECGDVAQELQAITQEHNSITNERDTVVQERNAITTERDAVVQELNTVTIERDVAVQQCKTITQERDENAQKNAAIILERDDLAQKLKTMTKERDVSAQQCKSITQARDEYAQKNAAVIQERDDLAQKLNITTKERNTITAERDVTVQQCKTITQEREEHAQKNSAVIQERDNLAQKLEATKERDTTTAERDTVMHDMTNKLKDMTKERDAISAERNTSVKKLEKKLKDAEDFISWQKSQITILELDEHQIASLKLQLKQSRTIQEDSWVEKVYLGREIAELEQQLSRVSQQASEMQAAGEYYMHAADQAASEAAYARQQRDNAYVACSAAQKMATASGQITHLEQQLDGLRATCASSSAKLVDAQMEATRLAAEKEMLVADLAAARSSSGAAHSVEVVGAVTDVTCVVAKYAALPKAEQKAGNQPSVGECPCYFHVERALRFARTYDMCHRAELDKANFERLCVEDELHELKREVALRSVAQAGCMEEKESEAGTVVEEKKEEEEEEEGEEGSVAESEESVEFILERPSSSPASSFTRRS